VVPLGKKWPRVKEAYHNWFKDDDLTLPELGAIQIVSVGEEIYVANMIGQEGIGIGKDGKPPVRYEAIEECLNSVYEFALFYPGITVAMPRIGSVRSGGSWEKIEETILKTMTVDTYIYTLPNERKMWTETYENEKDYE
jgi:hypothetical protein